MIKAIIFDYFDVLVHDAYWHEVVEHTSRSGDTSSAAQLNKDVNSGKVSWRQFCEKVAKEMQKSPEYVDERYHDLKINRRLIMYAHQLKNRGYKIGLLSNAASEYLRPILANSGLSAFFDGIAISTEINAIKPDESAYVVAVELLGVPVDTTVMVDDNSDNIAGALRAGLHGVRYTTFEQLKSDLELLLAADTPT